jgi:hypothetical protein
MGRVVEGVSGAGHVDSNGYQSYQDESDNNSWWQRDGDGWHRYTKGVDGEVTMAQIDEKKSDQLDEMWNESHDNEQDIQDSTISSKWLNSANTANIELRATPGSNNPWNRDVATNNRAASSYADVDQEGYSNINGTFHKSLVLNGDRNQMISSAPQNRQLTPGESAGMAKAYIDALQRDLGITKQQAQGIVANLWHESAGMNSGINQGMVFGQPTWNVGVNKNGYGLCQWGEDRKDNLRKYAEANKLDISSQAAQYGFLLSELRGPFKSSLDAVKKSGSAEQAMRAFMNDFEKPSDPQEESRLAILRQISAY